MEPCIVCEIPVPSAHARCKFCHEVFHFVSRLTAPERDDYVLIVDGSYTPSPEHGVSGAGLVLAREYDEVVIAYCATQYLATSSDDAEYQAIRRGDAWAPLGVVWSDNSAAIKSYNELNSIIRVETWLSGGGFHRPSKSACYIRPHMRDPLHNLAHRLANAARLGQWDKLDKLWIPGEVWP